MSNFLRDEIGVAMSGVKWDVANFKLWQSTNPNIILFTPKQPVLALGENGRYQFSLSQFKQQNDETFKVTGGTLACTVTSALQFNSNSFELLKRQWLTEMPAVGPEPPRNPKFIPLNTRKGRAQFLINENSGTPNKAHNDIDIGTLGGHHTFLVELSELGAQEWATGIRNNTSVPGGIKIDYEYLQMLPPVGALVEVDGKRMFRHISTDFKLSVGGKFFGGSAQISAAWEKMVREGTVKITFIGTGLDPKLEALRDKLVDTFAAQAREKMFNALFEPAPNIQDAKAGNKKGLFGGLNFAFKFRRETEIIDLNQEIRFEGFTWLKASMDADFSSMLVELDESYLTEVNTQISTPASVIIDADPLLEHVAVDWKASEGAIPSAPVFGSSGGQKLFTVTSQNINDVSISYGAQVNFSPSDWPIIQTNGEKKIQEGGNQVIIKPNSWVRRHWIYMFVEENGEINPFPDPSNYLICNVSFEGDHLPRPIRASSKIDAFTPLEFSYPTNPDPNADPGIAKFSAFGVIDKQLVRGGEQTIDLTEEAVFILASKTEIQLVSKNTVFSEATIESGILSLAERLRGSVARPVFPASGLEGESSPNGRNGVIRGTTVVFEVGSKGPSVIIRDKEGDLHLVRLKNEEHIDMLNDSKKRVEVMLEESGRYAESVKVIY